MYFAKIILKLLGIQDVTINDIKIWENKRKIQIFVQQKREKSHCQHCGLLHSRVHQWESKTLKAPPLGLYNNVTVYFKQIRGHCFLCDKKTLCIAEFIHSKFKGYLCSFAETAGRLMEETTCEAASRLLLANSKTLWSLDQFRMKYLFQFLKLPDDLDVSKLSADEVHFKSVKLERKNLFSKFHDVKFITNLVCTKASKILFNAPGRGSVALEDCLSILTDEQKEEVDFASCDLHDPFISVFKTECPNAKICVDRFHVELNLKKALEKVRRQEIKKADKENDSSTVRILSSSRKFVLFEKKTKLLDSEIKMLEKLRAKNRNINNALLMTEYFNHILNYKTVKLFKEGLAYWYQLVRESGLKVFRNFSKTVRKYRGYIENYIESRLTTAVSEGLNNKIKVLKRMGYGYADETSFRLKILQRCGYLNSADISCDQLFYRIS